MTEPSNIHRMSDYERRPRLVLVSDNPLYAGIERVSQRAPAKAHRIPIDNDDGPRTA